MDGNWEAGGAIYALDGGSTWTKNQRNPLKGNLHRVSLDPNSPNDIFYTFFVLVCLTVPVRINAASGHLLV